MGGQRKIAQKIVDKSADDLLAVKGNQVSLEQALNDYYSPAMLMNFDGDSYSSQDKSHGRLETRCALVNEDLSVLGDLESEWPELKYMGIMINVRQKVSILQKMKYRYANTSALKIECRRAT